MDSKSRMSELIDVTMQVAAETGLTALSLKKVTRRAGVSEALIYKYFETKENLLNNCFKSVHKQIASLFDRMEIPMIRTPEEVYLAVRTLWMTYFSFLVKNSYRTIFYFEYRDSPYIQYVVENDEEAKNTYFHNFGEILSVFFEQFHIYEHTNPDHLWVYVLDATGIFARRVIRGELPDTDESRENIWRLMFRGMSGLLYEQ